MTNTFKKGRYYIGDPCYLFDKKWSDVSSQLSDGDAIKLYGKVVCSGSTSYGDGRYTDNTGRKYGVDSGLIGILPISLIKIENRTSIKEINKSPIMHIVTFKEDFQVECYDGVFTFGDIVINTRDDEEEDDEDDEDNYWPGAEDDEEGQD